MDFNNLVVLITGAGGGLGRQYALDFAARGAKVVVNDFMDPSKVVQEITSKGGQAIPSKHSVEDHQAIIQDALNAYGKIDILINNAGILRDASLKRMTEAQFQQVIQIHLLSAIQLTLACLPIFKKQNFGKVINTSSAAGIYGNFGQFNYSCAKMGLHGLTLSLSKDIHINTIAPIARSKMTEKLLPPDILAKLSPEYVSPLVLYLCHPSTSHTGLMFECGAGFYTKVDFQATGTSTFQANSLDTLQQQLNQLFHQAKKGPIHAETPFASNFYQNILNCCVVGMVNNLKIEKEGSHTMSLQRSKGKHLLVCTPEHIKKAMPDILNMSQSVTPTSVQESYSVMFQGGYPTVQYTFQMDLEKVQLYHLGIQHMDVYEANMSILPCYYSQTILEAMMHFPLGDVMEGFDFVKLVHAYHSFDVKKETREDIECTASVKYLWDTPKGCYCILQVTSEAVDGLVGVFVRGAKSGQDAKMAMGYTIEPQEWIEETTLTWQAKLYRMAGDKNPLHIDETVAKMAGFDKPILHGMCTMGIVGKHLPYPKMACRMKQHVFPGDTLRLGVQRKGDKVFFIVKVENRVVLEGHCEVKSKL